jgi:cobalt-zinc-cadmium efflux system membrane fusion protein
MTSSLRDAPPYAAPAPPPAPRPKSLWKRVGSAAQFVVALAGTVGFLTYLLFAPSTPPAEPEVAHRPAADVVEVIGPGLIRVQPGSPLDKKIQVVAVRKQTITDPVLTVTGRVAASLRPGKDKESDFWQFDTPEVLTAYIDWQKAQADIKFAEIQLAQVKELAAARTEAQRQVLARAERGVSIGDGTAKEVATEKANLIQTELTGRKEVHEAETTLRMAMRAEAAAAKLLQQSGLDPELLRTATSDMDIVLADVPEGRLNRVRVGQGCQATFFGIPNERFSGKVTSIAPVLSKERRSLRVLFVIDDPDDKLRPGMFAEIGLGTDPRNAILAPADGVLHIGRADYVLTAAEQANTWRVTEVQVGEPHNGDVEILDGLKEGERVVGKGAILFKPLAVRALQPVPAATEGRR